MWGCGLVRGVGKDCGPGKPGADRSPSQGRAPASQAAGERVPGEVALWKDLERLLPLLRVKNVWLG